ncbi:PD40 domain-containing protein [Herpetosiphon sp.]|uniref:Periplasmic component of the Tol biopolymer transport system-like n=1 Tax=Herpetosiphon aurantiacus (strain ATCC 23779 / DSM 785 / 114-95) TaxID=316274 RepID=A9B6H0_HERA2|nr:PD40 domain-containing protein [Herpetosiphon sp.]ABX02873.1 Periplasmic component of the Tol biopolymer transport system-like [Herpetosiphon aurantiacus DSM 785]
MAQSCVVCRAALADGSVYCSECGSRQPAAGQSTQVLGSAVFGSQPLPSSSDHDDSPYAPRRSGTQPLNDPPTQVVNNYQSPSSTSNVGGFGQGPSTQPNFPLPQYTPPTPPNYAQPTAKSKNLGHWLIGGGLALLLIGGGAGAYYFLGNNDSNNGESGNVATGPTWTPIPTKIAEPTEQAAGDPLVEPTSEPTVEPTQGQSDPADQPTPTNESNDLPTQAAGGSAPTDLTGELIYLDDSFELVRQTMSTGSVSPLDLGGQAYYNDLLSWSPDGKTMAFFVRDGAKTNIYLADGDGSNSRSVIELQNMAPQSLSWSPDSSKFAFITSDIDFETKEDQNLYVYDLASNNEKQLTTTGLIDFDPLSWSPDNQTILFAAGQDGIEFNVINADGSNLAKLADVFTSDAWWTKDSKIIYDDFCDRSNFDRGVCLLDPATGEVETLQKIGDFYLSGISPDANWYMLDNYNDGSLLLINADTGDKELVAPPSSGGSYEVRVWGKWSPDGRYVTYETIGQGTFIYEIGSGQAAAPFVNGSIMEWLP